MCGNDADADDAAQEALLALVRGLRSYDGRAAFSTWSHRVVVNACLDELRRRSRRPRPVDDPDARSPGVAGERAGGPTPTGPGIDDTVSDRLDLDAALMALAPELRAAVVLRDVGGHDYAAIAAILGVPIGTVRSRLSRGRARLARLIDAGNPSPTRGRPTR